MRRGTAHTWMLAAVAAVLAVPASPEAAQGQYFGRNRVQYEDWEWKTMHSEHFDIYFYPEERVVTEDASRMAERWYSRFSALLGHEFPNKPLIFYANHPDFQQTTTTSGGLTEGTGGFTEPIRNRVVMPFTGVYKENDHVIGHELVHVFQFDIASAPNGGGLRGMNALPLWLIEGMAEYLSLGRINPHTAMWLRDAALRGDFPTIEQLTRDPRFFPYRYGQALWAYIGGRWGDQAIIALYKTALRTGWEQALRKVLGMTGEELSQAWITAVREAYLPQVAGRTPPRELGRPILRDVEEEHMNVGPVVSPDGRHVAYFSSRGLFSIDLYLADVRTGKVVKQLASPTVSAHFDNLSFINTAGSWSPDGRRFAFVTFDEGDNRLEIVGVESGDIEEEIAIETVEALKDPAWSPDGRSIAFSGMVGGISDLFIYDLETREARRLTNDRYAEIQPAWSPDGRTLVFVTDRGEGTDFDRLVYGEMQLAALDLASGAIRVLPVFDGAKHINPAYSPDGGSIYFVSDVDGVSDIFRHTLATGETRRLTRVTTGVSGITDLSPALSVASRTGEVVFSTFENGQYRILEMEDRAGVPVQRAEDVVALGVLPPVAAADQGPVSRYLSDPLTGLVLDPEYEVTDYDPSLGLEYLGTPTFGVAATSFGTGFAGGIAAYFTDLLRTQGVSGVVQAQGGLEDVGGQVFYQKLDQRWNWGVLGGHVPYLTGFTTARRDTIGGRQAIVYEQNLFRVYQQQLSGMAFYPFSTTRRFEANAGVMRLAFDYEVEEVADFAGGEVERLGERELESPDAVNLVQTSAAYVGDNSFFGFTSPIMGWRYRFEISPTFGTLQYQTALADYRRYFFKRPMTFALRGLHFGRYGRDADSTDFLGPLFVGHETLVRGYAIESFDPAEECTLGLRFPSDLDDADSRCPSIDRLVGSKIAVANAELRVPLFGVPGFGLINFPYLPTELVAFFDAGLAWSADDEPVFEFSRDGVDRTPVFSTGLSARMNILGYLVLEAYYAFPFQRPEKGWHWGFSVAPGW